MADIANRLGQDREQFVVEVASVLINPVLAMRYVNGLVFLGVAHLVGSIGPVNRNHVVVLARLAVLDEFFTGAAGEFLCVC